MSLSIGTGQEIEKNCTKIRIPITTGTKTEL